MSGHTHMNSPGLTQNQGNILGDRPCVRQSRLYREGCGGNAMKELLGQDSLKWDTTQTQGAYRGGHVYDHNTEDNMAVPFNGQQGGSAGVRRGSEANAGPHGGGVRVYTPKKSATPAEGNNRGYNNQSRGQPQQYASAGSGADGNYEVVAMDAEDEPAPYNPQQQQQHQQQQQQQQQQQPRDSSMQTTSGAYGAGRRGAANQESQAPTGEGRSVTGRGFRPGCGQANRQTYNIFTGQ